MWAEPILGHADTRVENVNWHFVREPAYAQAVGLCGCHSVETWALVALRWPHRFNRFVWEQVWP